jgi:alanine-glyoxylate transaminase/serine-glyoxylate transaminase/serine-pyruvate transaminase
MPDLNIGELNPPERLLMGPGPANVAPRVLQALSAPLLGHLDPAFIEIMDETVAELRQVFQTSNQFTIPISGTGSAGMEASLCNLLEPGDTIVIGVSGYFGGRMTEMVSRYGARSVLVEAEWGHTLDPEQFKAALEREKDVKIVALVHAETSTGVLQPVEEIAKLAHDHGALFLIDVVTSLGGIDVRVDEWGIDACFSGTQKCLGAPPGLAPLTLGPRAVEVLRSRKTPVANWYLDLTLLDKYWGEHKNQSRAYHHTAPISMVYSLREALRTIAEEGLEERFARHHRNASALRAGFETLGLQMLVPDAYRTDSLTTVLIPEGLDDLTIRRALLSEFSIEIGGGLGPLAGKVWRVGLMGYTSQPRNVFALLNALEQLLPAHGFEVPRGTAAAAAHVVLTA